MKTVKTVAVQLVLVVIIGVLAVLVTVSTITGRAEAEAAIHSRYTFTVDGLDPETDLKTAAETWEKEFLAQFTQSNLPTEKKLRNIRREPVQVLDEDQNIVDLKFSYSQVSADSEFFSTWGAVMSSTGNLSCEWVVTFKMDHAADETMSISVSSIQTAEEYQSGTVNDGSDSSKSGSAATTAASGTTSGTSNYQYRIKADTLQVSYDGGNSFAKVPVDVNRLPYSTGSAEALASGTYYITPEITAFLSGGMIVEGTRAPVSVTYSTDQGKNWTSAAIDEIYDVDLYYLRVVSPDDIIVALGYSRTDQTEYSKFYYLKNGTVTEGGSGYKNRPLTGIFFLNDDIGFFSYAYEDGDDATLYETRDGGATFTAVKLESQKLDSSAGNLTWDSVFVQALVPILNDDGNLVVYVTQGSGTKYNNGMTKACYVSTDEGKTFTYTGQSD